MCIMSEVQKCCICSVYCKNSGSMLQHLETHIGNVLSCRICRVTFNNEQSFLFHKKRYMCESKTDKYHMCECKHQNKCTECKKSKVKKLKKCLQCNETFTFQRHYKKHLEGHLRNNCKYCNALYSNRKHLIAHLAEEHQMKMLAADYRCLYCDKIFGKRRTLYNHYHEHANGQYVCMCCGQFIKTKEEFIIHNSAHQENMKKWKCEQCTESFSRRQQYLHHLKAHEKYQCSDCDKSFGTKHKLSDHKQNIHGIQCLERRHKCPECGKAFHRPGLLMLHFRIHTGEKPFMCQLCNKSFHSSKGCEKHVSTAHQTDVITKRLEDKFKCGHCSEEFSKKEVLTKHIEHIHKCEKPFMCQLCNKSFHSSKGCEKHTSVVQQMNVIKRIEDRYKCEHCDQEFSKKQVLTRHIERIHKCELMYKCDFCKQDFNSKENLKRHLALHTEKRQFMCEHCAAAFHSHSALKDHITYLHSYVRDFVCEECKKSFKTKSGLNRHSLSHSENRPYACDCGSSYKRLSHLTRHKESAHGEVIKRQKLLRLEQDERGELVPIADECVHQANKKPKSSKSGKQKHITLSESPSFVSGQESYEHNLLFPVDSSSTIKHLKHDTRMSGLTFSKNLNYSNNSEAASLASSSRENNVNSFDGSLLHPVKVSCDLNNLAANPTYLSNTETPIIISESIPVCMDLPHPVLTVTIDYVASAEGSVKNSNLFLEGKSALLLDSNPSVEAEPETIFMSNAPLSLMTSDTSVNNTLLSNNNTLNNTTDFVSSTGAVTNPNQSSFVPCIETALVPIVQNADVLLDMPSYEDVQRIASYSSDSLKVIAEGIMPETIQIIQQMDTSVERQNNETVNVHGSVVQFKDVIDNAQAKYSYLNCNK